MNAALSTVIYDLIYMLFLMGGFVVVFFSFFNCFSSFHLFDSLARTSC